MLLLISSRLQAGYQGVLEFHSRLVGGGCGLYLQGGPDAQAKEL